MKKTRSVDLMNLESRKMQDEHILRWLIEFGTDWVDDRTLNGSWADAGFYWYGSVKLGMLEENKWDEISNGYKHTRRAYKLTQKALDRLSNKVHEGELSYD